MKIVKALFVTFALSIIMACIGVQADDYLTLVGVDIRGGMVVILQKTLKRQ